jgi:hypothetical protein
VLLDDRSQIGVGGAELGDRRRERGFVEHAFTLVARLAMVFVMHGARALLSQAHRGPLALALLLLPR